MREVRKKMTSGSTAYPRVKTRRDTSMPPKREHRRRRVGDGPARPVWHGESSTAVRRVIQFRIPHSMRRLSDNEPGSSGLPTAERHGGPEHAGEAGAGEISEPNAPQDPRDRVKVRLPQIQSRSGY